MTSYDELLERWPRKAERPKHYADLLVHPIHDDPSTATACYEGWESDHVSKPRFYLGGTRWFRNKVGLTPNGLAEYRKAGLDRLKALSKSGEIDWRQTPGCQDNDQQYWGEVARVQFNRAINEAPLIFSKAMIILMTCEAAIEDLLGRGAKLPNVGPYKVTKPVDIHQRMSIIPAGWRVNNFNLALIEEVKSERSDFLGELARACGRTDGATQFLLDLAEGRTVQFSTAMKVRVFCERSGIDLGENPVRATPGNFGGRREASRHEEVFCG